MSQQMGRMAAQRSTAWILLAFGVVACIIGVVFIATNHDLRATASFIVGPLFYSLTVVVALFSPYLCLALQGALAIYYAFDPISRRVAHQRPRPG